MASRIKTAITFGDLTDNSEYEDAKNEQVYRRQDYYPEKMLRNARLIDHDDINKEVVDFGSTALYRNRKVVKSWNLL